MSPRTTFAVAAVSGLTFAAGAHAGVVNYSIHSNVAEASLGETVSLHVEADIDPQGGPFFALGAAAFSIMTNDVPAGGIVNFTGPGLGLDPSFPIGSPGTLIIDDIMNVQAAQLPAFLNPGINTNLNVTLYHFEYTVTDATPRTVTFDITGAFSTIFATGTSGSGLIYNSTDTPFELEITTVPAPGAAALLLTGGLFTGSRRRRS